jgi:cyclopropane-fatty-acyl-phospholipid synthase
MVPDDFSKFFAEEIFPESFLPNLVEIAAAAEHLFAVEHLRNDPLDYANTLRAWRANLKRHRDRAVAMVGAQRVARYERYFKLAIIAFEVFHTMTLYRITFKRIDRPRVGYAGEDHGSG